jgi:DNA invertase Pin-like site-specific DNA recombinase
MGCTLWVFSTSLFSPFSSSIGGFERHLIRARTDEGRNRAKARGVKFGRKPKLTPFQRAEALERLTRGETQADVARSYNVSQTTVSFMANGHA